MNELMRKLLFLPEQRSTIAQDIDSLHYFVILVTMGGATLVALAAAYFVLKYRQSAHRITAPNADPGHASGGLPLRIELALIIGLLALFVMWWVIGFRQFVRLRVAPQNAMEVYVTGKKWMWSFAYPDGSVSNAVVYVPVRRPVKLVMTSRDVIHSFFVPEFRVKQDVLPGRVTTLWFEVTEPGVYDILCTEYCGMGHSTMRGQVIALSDVDYEQRMGGGTQRAEVAGPGYTEPAVLGGAGASQQVSLAAMGERAASQHGCLRCHSVDGSPHIGPTFARLYGSTIALADGKTMVADEAYITRSMMDPLAEIHRGYPPIMPSYLGLLSAAETGAIVEYIRMLANVPLDQPTAPLSQGSGAAITVELPTEPGSAAPGDRVPGDQAVVEPLAPIPPPRSDEPPYSPPGTEQGTAEEAQ